jgi:hypothetical protein
MQVKQLIVGMSWENFAEIMNNLYSMKNILKEHLLILISMKSEKLLADQHDRDFYLVRL